MQSVYWKTFCCERNIGFLDLLPLFYDNTDPHGVIERYFIPGDHQWNERGHRLVADALFHYLTSGSGDAGKGSDRTDYPLSQP
jgi:hypothetical protein